MRRKYTPCTYVSVWDGNIVVGTAAKFDPETKEVFDIEQANLPESVLNSLDSLTRQCLYLETPEDWNEYEVIERDGKYYAVKE